MVTDRNRIHALPPPSFPSRLSALARMYPNNGQGQQQQQHPQNIPPNGYYPNNNFNPQQNMALAIPNNRLRVEDRMFLLQQRQIIDMLLLQERYQLEMDALQNGSVSTCSTTCEG